MNGVQDLSDDIAAAFARIEAHLEDMRRSLSETHRLTTSCIARSERMEAILVETIHAVEALQRADAEVLNQLSPAGRERVIYQMGLPPGLTAAKVIEHLRSAGGL